MAIKSGRLGQVMYDPAGTTPVALIAINAWKMDQKTDHIDVTCFGDTNKVYVPGLKDCTGEFSGFWDSTNRVLWTAVDATSPGLLKLVPNTSEGTFFWSGKAYLDASINTKVDGAPEVTGTFMAAGPWTMAPP
jgi:hypothetical protein